MVILKTSSLNFNIFESKYFTLISLIETLIALIEHLLKIIQHFTKDRKVMHVKKNT